MKKVFKLCLIISIIASLFGCSPSRDNKTDIQALIDAERYSIAYRVWEKEYSFDLQLQNEIIIKWEKQILDNKDYTAVDQFIETVETKDNNEYIEAIKTNLDNLQQEKFEDGFMTCFKLLFNNKVVHKDSSTYLECLKSIINQMFRNNNGLLSFDEFIKLDGFNVIFNEVKVNESIREYFIDNFILYVNNCEIIPEATDSIVTVVNNMELFSTEKFDQFSKAILGKIPHETEMDVAYAYARKYVFENKGYDNALAYISSLKLNEQTDHHYLDLLVILNGYFDHSKNSEIINSDTVSRLLNLIADYKWFEADMIIKSLKYQVENDSFIFNDDSKYKKFKKTDYTTKVKDGGFHPWEIFDNYIVWNDVLHESTLGSQTVIYVGKDIKDIFALDCVRGYYYAYFIDGDDIIRFGYDTQIVEFNLETNVFHQENIKEMEVVNNVILCLLEDNTLVKYDIQTKEKSTKQFVDWSDAENWIQ